MPYKLRNDRRHKFDKATYKIENWPEYNEALKERGNITFWFSEEAIEQWYPKQNKKKRPGAQIKYSDIAIQTGITIKAGSHFDNIAKPILNPTRQFRICLAGTFKRYRLIFVFSG